MPFSKSVMGRGVGYTNPLGFKVQPSEKTLAESIARMQKAEITPHQQWFIDRRIACPEAGYPIGEARWASIKEYVEYLENK